MSLELQSRPWFASKSPDAEALMIGRSEIMKRLHAQLGIIASSRVPVLIHGESGSGKELLARSIHNLAPEGSSTNFVRINCAAVPASLFESELFGYEKGAFTGANAKKLGRVATGHKGTLFLDGITELDSPSQAKLLQLLQDGSFCPVGGHEETRVDIRVICATTLDPQTEIANGNFRQDLYYRISVVTLRMPSLRERREDIASLAQHFIDLFNAKFNCQAKPLPASLIRALEAYDWPGNVRQLENLMKRYVILGAPEVVISELSPKRECDLCLPGMPVIRAGESISLKRVTKDMVRNFEDHIITKMLEAHRWNRTQAARALNISYRSLLYKVKHSQLGNSRDNTSTSR